MMSALMACVIGMHVATYHVDRKANYNEANLGTYIECEGWTAGSYRNSEATDSTYGGYTAHWGRFSVTTGLITGYSRGLTPMLIPSVRLTDHVRLAILPPVPKAKVDTSGIHLMVEY